MSENTSQSRYSIVASLTEKKLNIMEQKQAIDGEVESKKTKINQLKKSIEECKIEKDQELKREIHHLQQTIDILEQEISAVEKGKSSKSELCDRKIKEIDAALRAIADISKSSAEEAK